MRFLLEAEITGALEHPGIVPVYSLGTYGDGRPFYAMRFIKGDSLKEAIDRFHKNSSTDFTDYTDLKKTRIINLCNRCNLWIKNEFKENHHGHGH